MNLLTPRLAVFCVLLAVAVSALTTITTLSLINNAPTPAVADLPPGEVHSSRDVTQISGAAAQAESDQVSAEPPDQAGPSTNAAESIDAEDKLNPAVPPPETSPIIDHEQESTLTPNLDETHEGELARILRQLSDRELAALARGESPLPFPADRSTGTPENIHDLLLDELARRLDSTGDQVRSLKPSVEDTDDTVAVEQEVMADDDAAEVDKLADLGPVTVELESVVAEVAAGEPMSAVVLELNYQVGHGPILYPDQPIFLTADQRQTYYVSFDIDYQESSKRSPWEAQRVEVTFLVRDHDPFHVELSTIDGELLERTEVKQADRDGRFDELKQRWWNSFSHIPEDLGEDQRMLRQSLNAMLARRFSMSGPWPVVDQQDREKSTGLEAQFERAVGMLFGMESVKLAIQEDVTLNLSVRPGDANQPIPPKPRMASVNIPSFRDVRVEPIAMHVPEECFYVRTGSLANYKALRRLLTGWGGDLSDVVASGSVARETRKKTEFQLALRPEQTETDPFDRLISDMALVGCDPLFRDGAALGVVFHANDGMALASEIKRQRQQMLSTFSDVSETRVTVADHPVSFLSTDDNRVRSFYAIDGQYHIVTNSEYLLKRFFEAGRGDRSLGQLREFRYAISKADSSGQQYAFLYLSDPFFQNLVSPHYRIELTRRSRALRELRQYQLAALVAKSEAMTDESIDALIEAKLLPRGFGERPDGSSPILKNRRFQDSLRGLPGAFVPIPDVQIDKATQSEVVSYRGFIRQYNQQWRRVDPVTVVFTQKDDTDSGLERVGIEIVITPYARQKYALLERHLADPSRRRFARSDDDLLSVDTAVRMGRGREPHLLYIGLRDDHIPFAMNNGNVELVDQDDETTFAKLRSFGLISPPSTDILRMLGSVLLKGEPLPPEPSPRAPPAAPKPMPWAAATLPFGSPPAGQLLYYFGWAIANMPPGSAEASKYIKMIESQDGLTAVAMDSELRGDVLGNMGQESVDNPPKVRMHMGSLAGSQVEPYIQAYTFMQSRRVSAENARFLTDLTRWLNLPPEESRQTIENVLDVRLSCPLGGDYRFEQVQGQSYCSGTAWDPESLYQLRRPPESWKFPFLDWLRGLDLRFDLDQNTLHANVELTVHQRDGAAEDVKLVTR